MRDLTQKELAQIYALEDLLKGNLNRCCVTDSEDEFKNMTVSAYDKLKKILDTAYERFKEE